MELKQKLLNTSLFDENEYFTKYIDLVLKNKTRIKEKFKTQCHHILPAVTSKLYGITEIDSKENLVNLLYKDHILAHYYLALCSKDLEFKYKMITAINFILGKAKQTKLNVDELKKFTIDLEKYQQLYEESIEFKAAKVRGTTHNTSEETKKKISKSNGGRVYVNKDGVVKSIQPDLLNQYLEDGWVRGNPKCQHRDTKKGCTIINKDGIEKYIKREELEIYLTFGWNHGRSIEHKKSTQLGTQRYYDSLTSEEKRTKCATYGRLGKKCSNEQREKISKVNRGRKLSEEQRLKNSLNKKGTIHMTNSVIDVMIKPEYEVEYLQKGFYRGRSKNRKNR